jgi:hypothetical protein
VITDTENILSSQYAEVISSSPVLLLSDSSSLPKATDTQQSQALVLLRFAHDRVQQAAASLLSHEQTLAVSAKLAEISFA